MGDEGALGERALGSGEMAGQFLRRALAINPYFHPTFPALARSVIDSLDAMHGR